MHFQQLTGPVMAKSLEDTAFYRYNRLVSLNEVGGEPNHFAVSPSAFHHLMQQQQRRHPASMLATATHDHKRGGRARAPQRAQRAAARVAPPGRALDPAQSPQAARGERPARAGRNDEYLLYQTLVGAWPLEIDTPEHAGLAEFTERIVAYMIKASREAKVRTSWTAPDQEYEAGLERFVRRILDPQEGRAFLADLLAFQPRIALIGAVNGLAQTLLKLTAPGVPDTYQGCELWDLSLVDPDNRRPVDFELRRAFSSSAPMRARSSPAGAMVASSSTSRPARWRCGGAIRSCSRWVLRAARGRGRACRSRGRVQPPHGTGWSCRGGAAPGRGVCRSGAAVPRPAAWGDTRLNCRPRSRADAW